MRYMVFKISCRSLVGLMLISNVVINCGAHHLLWRAVCFLQGLTGRELAGLYSCGLCCGVREGTKSAARVRISVPTG